MALAAALAHVIDGLAQGRRILVGFDGPDCAGKTTLADLVAECTQVPTVRASVDDFQAPTGVRYRRGRLSPEVHYHDGFDYARLRTCLLDPYANGAGTLTTAALDLSDRQRTVHHPHARGALLIDGLFLLRPELRNTWTLVVYLHVSEDVTLTRAMQRDVKHFGSTSAVQEHYTRRYLPGQVLYRTEARPADEAHILIDNDDTSAPKILRWDPPGSG